MSGDQHTPAVAIAAGGSFTLTMGADSVDFTLTSYAMGITQAHIHTGAASVDGPVLAFFFGSVDPGQDGISVSGSIAAADVVGPLAGNFAALVEAISSGNAYVNMHTETYPAGEVRGQILAAVAPGALPFTGSGGLADASGGTADWLWALLAAGLVLSGVWQPFEHDSDANAPSDSMRDHP